MRVPPSLGLFFGIAIACAEPPAQAKQARREVDTTSACQVDRIADGDTFYCAGGEKVRLIGVDAPELNQGVPGRRSQDALTRMIPPGTVLRLELDVQPKDRYGRTLAYAWRDSGMINERMVRDGWALQYTVPPDIRYSARFRAAERAARIGEAGLWRDQGFACVPSEHRKGRC
ncbi:MAG: thermonuclease family protein [Gemmatimonadota bacterium]